MGVLDSSRSVSYDTQRTRISYLMQMPGIFCRIGRCSHESKRGSPKTAPRTARHFGLSLTKSCATAPQSPFIPGHPEREKNLRNHRFRMGNGGNLSNIIQLISQRPRPLHLPCVRLDSGARHTQVRRPSSTKTQVVGVYTG